VLSIIVDKALLFLPNKLLITSKLVPDSSDIFLFVTLSASSAKEFLTKKLGRLKLTSKISFNLKFFGSLAVVIT
jgi:hypothetical protein